MSEPVWVEAAELIAFNRLAVADTGEPYIIRDPGLLESALARPRQILHYDGDHDLVRLGCAMAVGIAQNHCFAQGNKRTAQAALFRFFWINGYTFRDPDDLILADLLIAVVDHRISEADYIEAIFAHIVAR